MSNLFFIHYINVKHLQQQTAMKKDIDLKQNAGWETYSKIIMILYIPIGLIVTLLAVIQIAVLFLSVIGIPFALVLAKSLNTIFNPVNKKCVPLAIAEELNKRKAEAKVSEYFGK